MTPFTALAVCLVIAAGYPGATASGQVPPAPGAWSDSSPHRSYFVVSGGVSLNCLDWGGTGPPLILLHGLGDSPHLFDDLASRLHNRFHVLAYARRGHGKSGAPSAPYDDETLVQDLRRIMDEVGFKHASLIGWGMGGDEVTAFAGRYPERVDKIVYLESGYDFATASFRGPFFKTMSLINATLSTARVLEALREWYHEAWVGAATPWSNGLEAYIRDIGQVEKDQVTRIVPDGLSYQALITTMGSWQRNYKKVQAPALALYSSTWFPTERSDSALSRQLRDFEQNVMTPFRRASIERIQKDLRNVKVQEIPNRTHVSIGVEDPDALAATISEFLGSPP